MDSRWSPCGVQMDFKPNYGLKSFLDGVQMESRVQIWNLWGSVKYRKFMRKVLSLLDFAHNARHNILLIMNR